MSDFKFSSRKVGIELEIPEFSDELDIFDIERGWEIKEDGSIPEDGRELVSPPISGDTITRHITEFYSICKSNGVRTEHVSCGTHVHINAVDIYAYINKHRDNEEALSTRVEEWGAVISGLSRLFVGPGRNGTRFATGGFAIRDSYRCAPGALKKSRRIDYPTVAIRENTFEFRIFPSTTKADYTLARIAFAQAAGDWLLRSLKVTDQTFKRRLAILAAPLESPEIFTDSTTLPAALEELKICPKAISVLLGIYEKFREGNSPVLPHLWHQERDRVRIEMRERRTAIDCLATAMEEPVDPAPDVFVSWLRAELGASFFTPSA